MTDPILTKIEKTLYDYLLLHKGEAIEREALYAVVNKTPVFASNLIDVHIKNLRRKLPDGTIETVRKVGYKLV